MIWKTPPITPAPRVGQTRIVRRFAWLPTPLDNGRTVWLESYYSLEEFREGFYDEDHWVTLESRSKRIKP